MGGSKSIDIGTKYFVARHEGIGLGLPDAILEVRGEGEKVVWSGTLTASGALNINVPELWGGDTDQGGMVGTMRFHFGESDQLPNPYLVEVFGDRTVAWRGFCTVVWEGGECGSNNPYSRALSYKWRYIKSHWDDECWYPEKAEIPLIETPPFSVSWSRTDDCPYTFAAPSDVAGWNANPLAHDTVADDVTLNWPSGVGAVGLAWLKIDAPDGVAVDFHLDVKVNYDDSGKVIGTHNVSIGAATAPADVPTYFGAEGVRVIVPKTEGAYSGWVAFACVDGRDIDTGAALGSPTQHRMLVSSTTVIANRFAMNPVHMIVHQLTQKHTGGEPLANLNVASFEAAADWYHAQSFGLCGERKNASESPADFIRLIEQIAGCSVTRSTADGLWYVDIANGEYDLEALPVITDNDVLGFKLTPAVLDNAINSASVKYFDPELKQTVVTAPVRALGLIRAYGEIRQTYDYRLIPTASIANRVSLRELLRTITPTSGLELDCKPTVNHLRRGQYVRLQLPKYGIADMVVLIGSIERGQLRSGAIKITAVEDTTSMPDTSYVGIERGIDTRPSQIPLPVLEQRVFEAPYTEVATRLPRAELAALPPETGFVVACGVDPARSRDFTLMVAPDGGDYSEAGYGDFCPSATLVDTLPIGNAPAGSLALANAKGLRKVEVGAPVLLGDEWLRVDDIDPIANLITLGRGCADTVPQRHLAGARLFFPRDAAAYDVREYSDGQTVAGKLLTNTGSARLALADATPVPLEIAGRFGRPYPPAGLSINADVAPVYLFGELTVTWAHRDRVLQADQLADQSMASIGPEPGTTYTVRTYLDDVLDDTQAGITGTTATVTPSGSGQVRIEVESERDGLTSWQANTRTFAYTGVEASPLTINGEFVTINGELIYME